MQNRCCFIGCFLKNSSKLHAHFTAGIYCLHGKLAAVWIFASVTLREVKFARKFKLFHIEVKFYPKAKSQTGLSSLRVSCKRALRDMFKQVKSSSRKQVDISESTFINQSISMNRFNSIKALIFIPEFSVFP